VPKKSQGSGFLRHGVAFKTTKPPLHSHGITLQHIYTKFQCCTYNSGRS